MFSILSVMESTGGIVLRPFTPRFFLLRPDRLYQQLRYKPRHGTVDLNDPKIEKILAEYGFRLKDRPRILSGGNRSHSLLLNTSQGKKVFKKYKDSMSEALITYEHSILTHLARVDFPAPRLAVSTNEQTLIRWEDQYYALFDFIGGGFQYHNYFLFPGQLRQFITIAGEFLALLHQALKDFTPEGYNLDGFKSQQDDRWRNLEWLRQKLAYCVAETSQLKENIRHRQATQLLEQANNLEKSLIQLETMLKKANLPRLIVHADYAPYNLLFRNSGPPIVLDFEMARLDWRVTELIYAWYRFGYDRLGFRYHKIKWFFDGYQTHFPLTQEEIALIPEVWKYLNLRQCVINWYRYCETHRAADLMRTEHDLQMVDWITTNWDTFLARL